MRKAIVFTAYDRPNYLRAALKSWAHVRHLHNWEIVARIEPGLYHEQIRDIFLDFQETTGHRNMTVLVNEERLGVLHHPWVAMNDLFERYYDFVIRAEDDLLVSNDILEYFEWAARRWNAPHSAIASVHGFSREGNDDPSGVELRPDFDPLIWGTWRHMWVNIIRDTWDHDYSTYNDEPGNQAGWDWNLNTRVYPRNGLLGVYPSSSRVDNIGVHGTHSTPENFYTAPTFKKCREQQEYRHVPFVPAFVA